MERLLCDILNIDTQNPPGNERVLAEYIRDYLADAPVETVIQLVGEGRANVVSRLPGRERGGGLLLNGHLDTVPHGGGWTTDPAAATVRDGFVFARGASDMKSGLAAMLYAFRRFALSGMKPARDVYFAGTCDEESGGLGARALAGLNFMREIGAIVIGEPTGNRLGLASKGCVWLRARVSGRTSHGAYPDRGVSAVEGAIALARAVRDLLGDAVHPLLGPATATITGLSGGVKANMVPDGASLLMDVRTLPGGENAAFIERAREAARALEAATPGLKIELSVENDRAPMETGALCPIVRKLRACAEDVLGREPGETGSAFFSDASVFLRSRPYDVILFGPGESEKAHTPDESASLTAVREAQAIFFKLLGAS